MPATSRLRYTIRNRVRVTYCNLYKCKRCTRYSVFFISDQANHTNDEASPIKPHRPSTQETQLRVCTAQCAYGLRVTYCNQYRCKKCLVFFITDQANHNTDQTSPRRQRRPGTQGTPLRVCLTQCVNGQTIVRLATGFDNGSLGSESARSNKL